MSYSQSGQWRRRVRKRTSFWEGQESQNAEISNHKTQSEAQIEAFVDHYNHHRYHESLGNLAPADVYFGRGKTILLERETIKRKTIQQ